MNPVQVGPMLLKRHDDGTVWYLEGLPVSGGLNSPFGPRTPIDTPAGQTSDFHSGIDIGAWFGTIVRCPFPTAIVRFCGLDSTGAQIVTLETEDGTGGMFVHMQGPMLGVGQRVRRGDIIGFVGSTGMSTGPHLHFMRMRYVREGAYWYPREALIDPLSEEGGFVEASFIEDSPRVDRVIGAWPSRGNGAYLVVSENATVGDILKESLDEGADIESFSLLIDGAWKTYIVGAPAGVNADFPSPVPQGVGIYAKAK